jgi:hypothetical protein
MAAQQFHRMAQVVVKLGQGVGTAGGVLAQLSSRHHRGVVWPVLVDLLALLTVFRALAASCIQQLRLGVSALPGVMG